MALAWASDGVHLAVVTGDNAHTIHVYRVDLQAATVSACVFSAPCHRGEPPQVFGVTWNNFTRTIDAGTRDIRPNAHAFVTYGVKHIRFWQYNAQAATYLGGALCVVVISFDVDMRWNGAAAAALTRLWNVMFKMRWTAGEGVFGSAAKQDIVSACYLPRAGAAVAAGTRQGDVYIWCSKTHQLRTAVTAHQPGATVPSWHTGKAVPAGVRAMALSHMQQQLVTGGADGAIMRWNIPSDGAKQLSGGLELASVFRVAAPLNGPAPSFSAMDCSPLGSPELYVGTHGCAPSPSIRCHALARSAT